MPGTPRFERINGPECWTRLLIPIRNLYSSKYSSKISVHLIIYVNLARQNHSEVSRILHVKKTGGGCEHREHFDWLLPSHPLAPSCSCGAPTRVQLLSKRIVIAKPAGILAHQLASGHMHARMHACIADIAMRRVRGLPGASQLSFRVINDMRSYRKTRHSMNGAY